MRLPKGLALVGPSGVGKSTLSKLLFQRYPNCFELVVSHTSRPPRFGEVDGQSYFFVNGSANEILKKYGPFLEHAEVHGNFYGTSVAAMKNVSQRGRICVLDVDVQGFQQLKRSDMDTSQLHGVAILPPSLEELEQRLRSRGSETEESVQTRLRNAAREIEICQHPDSGFEQVIYNSDSWTVGIIELDECVQRLFSDELSCKSGPRTTKY